MESQRVGGAGSACTKDFARHRQIQAHDAVLVEPHAACLDRVAYQSSQCRVQEGTSPLSWLSPQFFSFVDPDGEVEQLIGKVFAELSK